MNGALGKGAAYVRAMDQCPKSSLRGKIAIRRISEIARKRSWKLGWAKHGSDERPLSLAEMWWTRPSIIILHGLASLCISTDTSTTHQVRVPKCDNRISEPSSILEESPKEIKSHPLPPKKGNSIDCIIPSARNMKSIVKKRNLEKYWRVGLDFGTASDDQCDWTYSTEDVAQTNRHFRRLDAKMMTRNKA